jgi:hypothetical protein
MKSQNDGYIENIILSMLKNHGNILIFSAKKSAYKDQRLDMVHSHLSHFCVRHVTMSGGFGKPTVTLLWGESGGRGKEWLGSKSCNYLHSHT